MQKCRIEESLRDSTLIGESTVSLSVEVRWMNQLDNSP